MAQVRGHAHLGDADEVRLKHLVVNVASLKEFAQDVPHLLPDTEQAHRTAFGSFLAAH
jgi:hypothetical protein